MPPDQCWFNTCHCVWQNLVQEFFYMLVTMWCDQYCNLQIELRVVHGQINSGELDRKDKGRGGWRGEDQELSKVPFQCKS